MDRINYETFMNKDRIQYGGLQENEVHYLAFTNCAPQCILRLSPVRRGGC